MSVAVSVEESITLRNVHTKILLATLKTTVQSNLTSAAAFSVLTEIFYQTPAQTMISERVQNHPHPLLPQVANT